MGSLLGFLAEQQVSHDDPFYVNNAVEGFTGIDTTLWDSPWRWARRGGVDLTAERIAELGDVTDIPGWADRVRALVARDGVSLSAVGRADGLTAPTVHQRLSPSNDPVIIRGDSAVR